MTISECYSCLHGDYLDAKKRLMNDRLIEKFILKFPYDDSILIMRNGINRGNIEDAFRGVHTLKGVSANLAFSELYEAASALTEQLRNSSGQIDSVLIAAVESSYKLVVDSINKYVQEKET